MAEYIEREALIKKLEEVKPVNSSGSDYGDCIQEGFEYAVEVVKAQPAADVVEVRHGEWLNFYGDYSAAECSVCGEVFDAISFKPSKEIFDLFKESYKYCPNCGAKMDGKDGADNE